MLFKFKKGKFAFFKSFLASYLIILIIPLVLSSFVYNEAVKVIEQDSIESRLFLLRHIRDSVDKHLRDLNEAALETSLDSELTKLMSFKEPIEGSSDMFWFYDYSKKIRSQTANTNTFKTASYLFIKNSEAVFSQTQTSFGFEENYSEYLNYSEMNYTQWYNTYFGTYAYKKIIPSQKVRIDGIESSVITYLFTLPIVDNRQSEGIIAYLIDEGDITRLLQGVNMDNEGWTFITNEKGEFISASANSNYINPNQLDILDKTDGYSLKQINDEDMLIIYTKSQFNDWIYSAILPYKAVMGKVQYIRTTSIVVAAGTLFICLLISLYLSIRNTRPFKELFSPLLDFLNYEKEENKLNYYNFLKGSISSLISNNKMMEASLQRQSSALKTVFLDRLLKGEFDDKHKMETLMTYVGIDIKEKDFVVIVLKINRHDSLISQSILGELDIFRAVIEDILQRFAGDNCYIHILNENEVALLLNLTFNSHDNQISLVENTIQNVSREMAAIYPITPAFGIGNIYQDPLDVYYSFNEARQALNFLENHGNDAYLLMWYSNIPKEIGIYYYPNDLEIKLINYAKSGSWNLLELALNKIYEENFSNRIISSYMKKLLLFDMQSTILKLLEETRLNLVLGDDIYTLSTKEQPEKFFLLLKSFYRKICNIAITNKKSHNNELKVNILEFIDENYTNANLSVSLVASQFNLSESYFSQFFKEQTGVNFSNYVENARIKLACELLTENRLSIDEISGRCGYNSTNSFRRTFKKVMGIVPTAYVDAEHKVLNEVGRE